jgi:hypothetical protein
MQKKDSRRDISGIWFPRVMNGLGTEARYRDSDEIVMFRAGEERIALINHPRTTGVLLHAQQRPHSRLAQAQEFPFSQISGGDINVVNRTPKEKNHDPEPNKRNIRRVSRDGNQRC